MRVHIYPSFSGEDKGDGGVRRVVEAQLRSLPRLRVQFTSAGDADLIASHIMIPDEYLRLFPDKPFVSHCHGLYWAEYEWETWAYKANKGVLKSICTADAVTAPTEWVAQTIRRHTSRKVYVVPHGVSGREWQPGENRGYVLWNKTRVDSVCSPDDLNVLARVMPDIPFVSTFGDERANMTLTGRLSYEQGKELVRSAGVYLCTARETFGIGTLEAMACAVPIVGYNFGGQAEYIEHGKDGWLAEPGDIRGLAEGVRWALANRETAGKAAREKALTFTWTKAAQMYHEIYREVVDRYERRESSPRTTIVVPAFKLEKYLPDTLDSVLAQTDPDWECIVVNDASPDNCGPIAESYASRDERIRVIHNEANLYLAESRNRAIEQARGRYILPLDADDMLAPHTVGLLADALDAEKTLQCAYGNVLFVDEDGKTPTDYHVSTQSPGHSGWPMPFDGYRQITGANLLPYCSMYRKDAWDQVGGYRRRLRTSEDADFWTRFASFGFRTEQVSTADTLVYRNREGSMSRVNTDQRYAYLRWFPWAKDPLMTPAGLAGDHAVTLLSPKVAVVIPVGPGHERHVQDAVDSVMAQSYILWECIVVNDSGGKLHLPPWAKEIRCDARDVGAARNLGIAAATASLFLPLDADDYLQPDALQWLVSAYTESNGDIIYPDFFEDPEREGEFKPYRLRDWNCADLTERGTIHSVTALTPVDVWRRVGGYAEGQGWEDWDFQLRCAEAGACTRRLAAPLFNYRKHTGKRRDYDQPTFEARKQEILGRWSDYFEGRKTFMACGCRGGTVTPPQPSQDALIQQASVAQFGEAAMVEYTGQKAGSVRYRAPSGAIYDFAQGDTRWVAGGDVSYFVGRPDFRLIADGATVPTLEPVLSV